MKTRDHSLRLGVLIGVAALLASCQPEHTAPTDPFPATLYPTAARVRATKVYTRTGEVTDPALVRGALKTAEIGTTYTVPDVRLYPPNEATSVFPIQFLASNTFRLEPNGRKFIAEKVGNDLVFTAYDPEYYLMANYFSYSASAWYVDRFYKYRQLHELPGQTIAERTRFSGYGDYQSFTIRGVHLWLASRDSVTRAIVRKAYRSIYNEFDEESLKYLGRYDTIVVKPYDMNFSAR